MHVVDGDEEAPDDKFTVEDPASPAPATGAESPHERDKTGEFNAICKMSKRVQVNDFDDERRN